MHTVFWIFQVVILPIACSVYASIIVARYLDFSQIRAKAQEIQEEVSRRFFFLSYRGREKYDEDFPKLPGQRDGLLLWGDLTPLSWKLKEKGHTDAAEMLETRCMQLCNELTDRLQKGKFSEEEWNDYFKSIIQPSELHPNMWPLFTPFKWTL